MEKYKIGQNLIYFWNDFDGRGEMICTVIEVYEDHAIAIADGMRLWIDDSTKSMFRPMKKACRQ